LDQEFPTNLGLHLVIDNYGTHSHPDKAERFPFRPPSMHVERVVSLDERAEVNVALDSNAPFGFDVVVPDFAAKRGIEDFVARVISREQDGGERTQAANLCPQRSMHRVDCSAIVRAPVLPIASPILTTLVHPTSS
jgi:hypothetical protein